MNRSRRHTLACALAGLALACAAALAAGQTTPQPPAPPGGGGGGETTFTFTGRGWGHGVGLSQYGARGRSLAGWDAARILRHYYQRTTLSVVKRSQVRVLLATGRQSVQVWSPGRWRAVGLRPNGRRLTALTPGATHVLQRLPDGRLALDRGNVRVAIFTDRVRLQAVGADAWVSWGARQPEQERRYRGGLRAIPAASGFDLVNVLSLEDYLLGVVPSEVPASWANDAYSAVVAQAVAARTYALATMSPTATYDVFDDTRSQVYGGVDAEDPRTTRAVRTTRGTVLTYDGQVITAFFFSTSGGRTEDVQNVFRSSGPRPYLVSVPDPYDRVSPLHTWPDTPSFGAARLGRLLGLDGPVTELRVLRRGVSPRVMDAEAVTASGRRTRLTGAQIRAALGLRDTWFTVTTGAATPAAR